MTRLDMISMSMVCALVSVASVSDVRAGDDEDEIVFEVEDVENDEAGAEIVFDEDDKSADIAASPETVEAFLRPFKFGMTREQVLAVVTKEITARYEKDIRSTMDTYKQDRLRRKRAEAVERVKKTLTKFDGKRSGWDASIIDDQFAHGTTESMLVSWETKPGQGQRRYFFFFKGKLYKVLLALDVNQMSEEQREFDVYANSLKQRFGSGKQSYVGVLWKIGPYRVEALNKLAFYSSFVLVMSDAKMLPELTETREQKAIEITKQSRSLKFLIDDDPDAEVDLEKTSNVIDDILRD